MVAFDSIFLQSKINCVLMMRYRAFVPSFHRSAFVIWENAMNPQFHVGQIQFWRWGLAPENRLVVNCESIFTLTQWIQTRKMWIKAMPFGFWVGNDRNWVFMRTKWRSRFTRRTDKCSGRMRERSFGTWNWRFCVLNVNIFGTLACEWI